MLGGKWTNIRFIKFEIQKRIEESLPLSRLMMPKVPISSLQWRRNWVEIVCVLQRRILGCREKSRGYFTCTKENKFYDVLTHSRKQKHTPTHSHTHGRNVCCCFFSKMSSSLAFTLELHYASCENLLLRLFFNQLHGGTKSRLIHSSCWCCLLKTGELFFLLQQLIHRVLTGKVSPEKVKISLCVCVCGEELNPTCTESTVQPTKLFSPTEQKNVYALSARDYHHSAKSPKLPCAICRKNVDFRNATSDRAI